VGTHAEVKKTLRALIRMQQTFRLIDWGMLDAFGQTQFLWNVDISYTSFGGKVDAKISVKKVPFLSFPLPLPLSPLSLHSRVLRSVVYPVG
jgi:hypothetical protein